MSPAPAPVLLIASSASVTSTSTTELGAFSGTFRVTRFLVQNGQLMAQGNLTGAVTNALGDVVATVNQSLVLPVLDIHGTCQILHLELGPLDLNLLGLLIHVDRIVLDITGQFGSGNPLGNLLCVIATLLDGGGPPLSQVAGLLNQLLGLVR